MPGSVAVTRYSKALLGLAEERGSLKETFESMQEVLTALNKHPEISHLILNPTIARQEKEDFIDKVFPSPMSKLVVEFLKVLVKKHRFNEFTAIFEEFSKLYNQKRGFINVLVKTAVPLSKGNQEKLQKRLEEKLKSEIQLSAETDSQMIGGLTIQYNGFEINGSYRNHLNKIKQEIFG